MASEYLASELLVSAMRDIGMLSSQDETATTERLLGHLNRERRVWLAKVMMSVREGYNKATVTQTVASGETSIRIPASAVGAKIDLLEVSDGNGGWVRLNETKNDRVGGDARDIDDGFWYFLDNRIYFAGTLAQSATVRITYIRRSSKIVDAEDTREITAINTGTGAVTLAGADVPTDFATTATSYDFIQGTPHFEVLGTSLSATRSSQVLTFSASDLPEDLAVGDYVALAGETPIVQAPVELQDVLCYRAVFQYLRSIGDPKADRVKEDLAEMETAALQILSPRAESHSRPLINYYAPGWRRFNRRRLR